MKTSVSAFQGVCGLAMLTLALIACSAPEMATGPQPGVATVSFTPRRLGIPYIDLTSASLRLDRLAILGNVPPPPNQPPPDHPPPQDLPPRPHGFDLDALSNGASATIEDLPEGLYSRVSFMLGWISLEGSVQSTKFHVALRPFGTVVNILASNPQELGFDRDIAFEISLDPNLWFPPGLFNGAMLDSRGDIVCDDVTNTYIGMALTDAMTWSFRLP
jgi:hypothetical protein